MKIEKVLIANRGEIACRIIRSAKKLGIKTIAIYSEVDADHPHTRMADEAYCVGPAAAQESYLNQAKILEIAKQTGANAVHPGYGFLAENPEFVSLLEENGIIFVGPSADAMKLLGHKDSARQVASKAKVPVLPGYDGGKQDDEELLKQAKKIGYPLMIKARAGGGGKGIRIVEEDSEMQQAIESTRREAKAFFDDDHLLLERYVPSARHIEVQIIADSKGNVCHLFERECSMQRRRQKVVEEAPAANLSDKVKSGIYKASVSLAKEAKLSNANTIEFLVPLDNKADEFFFLEANCRIQVEHAVTEEITGVDIVETQFRVAQGEALPFKQKDLIVCGHSIEVRICAELPARNFLPSTGTLLSLPETETDVRFEHALREGLELRNDYDSMIAKIIVNGADRDDAIRNLSNTLSNFTLQGIETNIQFLLEIISREEFITCSGNTRFLDEKLEELTSVYHCQQTKSHALLACTLAQLLSSNDYHCTLDPFDNLCNASKLKSEIKLEALSRATGDKVVKEIVVENHQHSESQIKFETRIEEQTYQVECENVLQDFSTLQFSVNGEQLTAFLHCSNFNHLDVHSCEIYLDHQHFSVSEVVSAGNKNSESDDSTESQITSPLPGVIVKICFEEGDQIEAGDTVCLVESMKMEHNIVSDRGGSIRKILVSEGSQVQDGEILVTLDKA